jgi:hypothetical protein
LRLSQGFGFTINLLSTKSWELHIESLIGEKAPPSKRGPTPQLQQKIERLTRLPKAQQRLVLQMLDGVLAQASR